MALVLTPYLIAHPSLADKLRQPASKGLVPDEPNGETGRYFLENTYNGAHKVLFDSGWMTLDRAKQFRAEVRTRRLKGSYRVTFHYRYIKPHTAGGNLSGIALHPFNRRNDDERRQFVFTFAGSLAGSAASREKARSSALPPDNRRQGGNSDSSKEGSLGNPGGSGGNQRPFSESLSKTYTRVDETATAQSSSVNSYVHHFRSWSGVRTPGFRSLKPKQYPINNHTVNTWTVHQDDLIHLNRWSTGFSLLVERSTLHYPAAAEPQHITGADERALKRLIEKAGSKIEANLAQDFAQIGQTTELIRNTIGRLIGAWQQCKRGNPAGAATSLFAGRRGRDRKTGRFSATKSAADNWLELQYGWKPLLNDIHYSFLALAKYNLASGRVQLAKSSATKKLIANDKLFLAGRPGEPSVGFRLTETSTTCKYGIRYGLDNALVSFLSQTGFTNPVNLAWEVLPFSFVVDWFLPIGPWLETLSAWHGLSLIDGYQVMFTKQKTASTVSHSGPLVSAPLAYQDVSIRADYSRTWVKLSRTKLSSFPVMPKPSFKNGASLGHTLNALALLRAAFK